MHKIFLPLILIAGLILSCDKDSKKDPEPNSTTNTPITSDTTSNPTEEPTTDPEYIAFKANGVSISLNKFEATRSINSSSLKVLHMSATSTTNNARFTVHLTDDGIVGLRSGVVATIDKYTNPDMYIEYITADGTKYSTAYTGEDFTFTLYEFEDKKDGRAFGRFKGSYTLANEAETSTVTISSGDFLMYFDN